MSSPKFPKLPTADVTGVIKQFETLVDESKTANGRVSVSKLRDKIDSVEVNDAVRASMRSALDTIEDAFPRKGKSGGCGSSSKPPAHLSSKEVTTVLGALAKAQTRVKSADANHDGKLSPAEASKLIEGEDMASQLLVSTLDPKLAQYKKDLRIWNATIVRLADKIEERANLDDRITSVAGYHCQTKQGAAAVAWAYRLEAIDGYLDTWSLSEKLKDAESSVMSLVPLTKKDASWKGHLSDAEVKKFLGTSDLASYVTKTKAKIKAELKVSYDAYLKGEDAPKAPPPPSPKPKSSSPGC